MTSVQIDEEVITNISKKRNQIQHYEIDISYNDAVIYVGEAIGFLIRFIKAELNQDIKDLLPSSVYVDLVAIQGFYDDLLEIAKKRLYELGLKHNVDLFKCSQCFEEMYAVCYDPDISECQFCGFVGNIIQCARCGEKEVFGGSNPPNFFLCNSCEHYIDKQ